jgi:hypothetical protein
MRLSDLAEWQVLKIKCCRCKHYSLVDGRYCARKGKLHLHAQIGSFDHKCRCTKCRQKGDVDIEIGPRPYQRD